MALVLLFWDSFEALLSAEGGDTGGGWGISNHSGAVTVVRGWGDFDVDVLAEVVEEAKETLEREAAEIAAEKERDLGLGDFEDFGDAGLGELALLDDFGNFPSKLSFGEGFFRIGKAKVSKDIA